MLQRQISECSDFLAKRMAEFQHVHIAMPELKWNLSEYLFIWKNNMIIFKSILALLCDKDDIEIVYCSFSNGTQSNFK